MWNSRCRFGTWRTFHAVFHNHFNQDRHLIIRDDFKARRSAAFADWKMLAG